MRSNRSFVYVMYAPLTGLVKIGKSDSPEQRRSSIEAQSGMAIYLLAQIQCASPESAFALERLLHEKFAGQRSPFGEWFEMDGPIPDWLRSVVYGDYENEYETLEEYISDYVTGPLSEDEQRLEDATIAVGKWSKLDPDKAAQSLPPLPGLSAEEFNALIANMPRTKAMKLIVDRVKQEVGL